MPTIKIKDADGIDRYMNVFGAGTDVDPFSPVHAENKNVPQQALVYKSMFKDLPHDATNRNMAVDGSTTPVRFTIAPPAGQIWQLTRMIMMIRDTGTFDSGGWGAMGGTPLPNGMTAGVMLSGVDYDMTPIPWTSHADLGAVAYDIDHHSWGAGDEFLVMRLTFAKAGQNFRFVGDDGDHLWMQVNDDLTPLVEQRVMCQGFIEDLYL